MAGGGEEGKAGGRNELRANDTVVAGEEVAAGREKHVRGGSAGTTFRSQWMI